MNIHIQKVFSLIGLFALVLFVSNGLFIKYVNAQVATTDIVNTPATVSQFKDDVEKGLKEITNDTQALSDQKEIDGEDTEQAGDNYAITKEIDGESNQSEIDKEIESEVEQEDGGGESLNQGNNGDSQSSPENSDSTSTDNYASTNNNGDN